MNPLVHIRQKKKFAQEIEAEIASGSKLNRYLGILVQIQKVLHKNKSLFPIKLEVTACFFLAQLFDMQIHKKFMSLMMTIATKLNSKFCLF